MQLNKEQITQLKKLISYKGYPEIDVQFEILDHVACKVEELMEHNPKLSLPDAFQKVHASFGIFGFSELEESYKKMIGKRIRCNYFQELKHFFFSYRIIYPLGLLSIFYHLSLLFQEPNSLILLIIGFVIISFGWIVINYWNTHKNTRIMLPIWPQMACFRSSTLF